MVLMYAWIFSKISGAPGKFHLLAKGQQILWRSIVMMLPVVPLLIAVGLGLSAGSLGGSLGAARFFPAALDEGGGGGPPLWGLKGRFRLSGGM